MFLRNLLMTIEGDQFEIISPEKHGEHGGHLALKFTADKGKLVKEKLGLQGIVLDARAIDKEFVSVRIGLSGLINTEDEISILVEKLSVILKTLN